MLARFNFEFVVDLLFIVALKRGSRVLAGIDFEGTLTGAPSRGGRA